jgi:hypothetical protein
MLIALRASRIKTDGAAAGALENVTVRGGGKESKGSAAWATTLNAVISDEIGLVVRAAAKELDVGAMFNLTNLSASAAPTVSVPSVAAVLVAVAEVELPVAVIDVAAAVALVAVAMVLVSVRVVDDDVVVIAIVDVEMGLPSHSQSPKRFDLLRDFTTPANP